MTDYLWELDAESGRPLTIVDLAVRTKRDGFRRGWWYEPAYNLVRSGLAAPVWSTPKDRPNARRHKALVITDLGRAVVAEWRREGYRRPRSYGRKRRRAKGVKK